MKNKARKLGRSLLLPAVGILLWLVIWRVLAQITGNPLLLPAPLAVFRRLVSLALTAAFWRSTLYSLLRVLGGIVCGVFCALLFAPLTAFFPAAEAILKPMITVVKSTPVSSFIILAMLWIDRGILPIFISFLLVFPVIWSSLHEGLRHTPKELTEVAVLFRFSLWKKIKRLYVPCVLPYFLSACRSSFGLAWKSGIAAEVLALPALSIGWQLYNSKITLETEELFAWTLTVILLSLLFERTMLFLFTRLMQKRTEGGAVYHAV